MRRVLWIVGFAVVGVLVTVAAAQERTRTAAPADPFVRKSEVDALQREVRDLKEQVAALRSEVVALTEALKAAPPGRRPAVRPTPRDGEPSADEIQTAIREHRFIVGMTKDEARKALPKLAPRTTYTSGRREVVDWGVPADSSFVDGRLSSVDYTTTFDDGRITSIQTNR